MKKQHIVYLLPSVILTYSFLVAEVLNFWNLSPRKETHQMSLVFEDVSNTRPLQKSISSHRDEDKFFLYWVQGGWSNQLMCLSTAYQLAWASQRRTLVVAPIMPHLRLSIYGVFDFEENQFMTDRAHERLVNAYVTKNKKEKYVSVTDVLDLEYSLPGVKAIDFRDYVRQHSQTNHSIWVMEKEYAHHDTLWVYRQPELVGQKEHVDRVEHHVRFSDNVEVRDFEATTRRHDETDNVWILLDSFRALSTPPAYRGPKNINNTATANRKSLSELVRPFPTAMKPRFTTWIRQIAYEFVQSQRHWSSVANNRSLPLYAAMHLRGGDGPFKTPKAIKTAIAKGMDALYDILQKEGQDMDLGRNNSLTVGVYVATDIADLASNRFFIKSKNSLVDRLAQQLSSSEKPVIDISLAWHFSSDLETFFRKNSTKIPGRKSGSAIMDMAPIFLDQQVAACATLGFVPTPRSTFSNFIRRLRRDSYSQVCGFDEEESG